MLTTFHVAGRPSPGAACVGCGAMAQFVARLHGMQKVRGSNPLSSTVFFENSFGWIVTNIVTISRASFLVPRLVVRVAEDVIHDGRAPPDRRPDDVPVDGLGDVGRLVADR